MVVALNDDLDRRVLHIGRAVSAGEVGPTKSCWPRTLTLGASTARLWERLETDWRIRTQNRLGPWLLARDNRHEQRLSTSALDHRFRCVRDQAGAPEASLHRLRHNVATFLVARGEILQAQAQARLGHRDAATTLREYAYALPLSDGRAADAINDHLDGLVAAAEQPANTEAEWWLPRSPRREQDR